MKSMRPWIMRLVAVMGLTLFLPVIALAVTTQSAASVSTVKQTVYAYDGTPVQSFSDNVLGSEECGNAVLPFGLIAKIVAPKTVGSSLDDLSRAAGAADKGGFTAAGRSLTKHGSGARPGNSLFPAAKGNPAAINRQAQGLVCHGGGPPALHVVSDAEARQRYDY